MSSGTPAWGHSTCPQTGFQPTQQQPKADCGYWGADEKHWKKPETGNLISVTQKPKGSIPTSMNRQWNKPILVFVFLSSLPFTLLGFFSCRTERQQKEGLHDLIFLSLKTILIAQLPVIFFTKAFYSHFLPHSKAAGWEHSRGWWLVPAGDDHSLKPPFPRTP